MTPREETVQEGKDAFNSLTGFCFQDPCDLNPYNSNKKSDDYIYWMYGWLDAGADFWESMASD